MPTLIVTLDGATVQEITLTKERTTLGRRPYNDVLIDNLAVSGEHAVFHYANGRVEVEDRHSTNGTYVNGQAVQRQRLQHGDVLGIGKHVLRFVDNSAPAIATTTTPQGAAKTATVRVLSGPGNGRDIPLTKIVTTIGKPGVAVASITQRLHGHVLAHVEGASLPVVNGTMMGAQPLPLSDGDRIALAGIEMEFLLR